MQENQQNKERIQLCRFEMATIVLKSQVNELDVEHLVVPTPANSVQGAIHTYKYLIIVIWRLPTHFIVILYQ